MKTITYDPETQDAIRLILDTFDDLGFRYTKWELPTDGVFVLTGVYGRGHIHNSMLKEFGEVSVSPTPDVYYPPFVGRLTVGINPQFTGYWPQTEVYFLGELIFQLVPNVEE